MDIIQGQPTATIDLSRVEANTRRIAQQCGVPVIAVIKADAYGLDSREVVRRIADLVDGFYCFSFAEAFAARTFQSGKPTICLLDAYSTPKDFRALHCRPVVWDAQMAKKFRAARPVLAVDTGMQRFACPAEQIDEVIKAGKCDEAFTHATRPEHAQRLVELCGNRGVRLHAASSSLLDCAEARLDAVRPGLALYRDAVRITTHLLDARDSRGPIGYAGFTTTTGRHGVLAGGYTTGVKPGICVINGQRRRIIECGMQSSFVEIDAKDRAGDEVVLLGDELPLEDVATARKTTPHETLWRMSSECSRVFKEL